MAGSGRGFEIEDSAGFFPLLGLEFGDRDFVVLGEGRKLEPEADINDDDDDRVTAEGVGCNLGILWRF